MVVVARLACVRDADIGYQPAIVFEPVSHFVMDLAKVAQGASGVRLADSGYEA